VRSEEDWLREIAGALHTPLAYFLDEARGGKGKNVPDDPRKSD
jgi:hypothetical protein